MSAVLSALSRSQTRLESHAEMISIEAHYLNFTRHFLFVTGLWPYRRTMLVKFQCVFILGLLTTTVILQLTPLVIAECSLDFIIDILSFATTFMMYVIKFNSFWINNKMVRYILEQFQRICNELKDENELAIIVKYGTISRRYAAGLAIYCINGIIMLPLMQYLPDILNIVLPKNESRLHYSLFPVEQFLDQRYLSLVRLHINATFGVGTILFLGITAMVIASCEYVCALFTIASYRIDRAMRIDVLQNVSSNSENLIFEGIIRAVDIHRKAIKLAELLISTFDTMFTLLIVIGIMNLSLNIFRVFQIMTSGFNFEKILFPSLIVIVTWLYMFLMNYIGQRIINHNCQIFTTVYKVQWYKAPLRVQRTILFLLQKATKDFKLKVVSGMITASLQCFVMLTNTSLSYFTLMYSVQR